MRSDTFARAIAGLSLVAVLAAAGSVQAQIWNARVFGGWNNASFYGGSKVYGSEDINGFIAGAAAEYLRAEDDVLGFEFGLAWSQKGAWGTIEPNAMDPVQPPITRTFVGELRLDYLEIFMLFDIHLPMGANSEIKLGIGPALGVLMSADVEGTLDGEPVQADFKDYLTSADFGVVLSAGFAYDFEKYGLFADYRTNLGAVSIDDTPLENDAKTLTHSVVVGVQIPLAR